MSLREIDGYDYVFLATSQSDKQFAYNLDTNQFLTRDLPDYSYSKDELLYFGDRSSARNQVNDSNMWGYLKREGNLDELLKKLPAQKDSYLSAHLNVIQEIDNVDTSKQENKINLFNENPEVKHIYEEAVNQTTNSDTLKKFKLLVTFLIRRLNKTTRKNIVLMKELVKKLRKIIIENIRPIKRS